MDLSEVNGTLNHYVRVQTYPVAVKLCKTPQDLPARVKGWAKNNLSFSHPVFRPSSSAPQSQSPQNSSLFLWL